MHDLKRWNRITGWIIFAIAAVTYILTLEPTVSYWDCGEFITSAFKLEVGHPPGAPLFVMCAKVFSLCASNPAKVAIMINTFSALASAFAVMFLFWTITALTGKIISRNQPLQPKDTFVILAAGVIGSLSFAFSDSFWFSAVEAEVYATSMFFTALTFWCVMKWEANFGTPYANRWLILIAYLIGLSIGVHLLNLLVIPSLVLVYYFKYYKYSILRFLFALVLCILILALVQFGLLSGFLSLGASMELLFVNHFHFPYQSGILTFVGLVFILLGVGIWLSHRNQKVLLNTILLAVFVLLMGFGSYAVVVIRSCTNPPMNENAPDNIFALMSYLGRDQYGESPLLYGQYYNAPVIKTIQGAPVYIKEDNRYIVGMYQTEYEYDKRYETIFPRMFSNDPNHIRSYRLWADIQGTPVANAPKGDTDAAYVPTFLENLRYFMNYQIGYMYLRYLGWNFIGRQNNLDGDGGIMKGNWLSGIPFIDNQFFGPQQLLPAIYKQNKGRCTYFFLPFLAGIIGFLFQMRKSNKDFWVVLIMFIMTGLAIVVYLNQTPLEPRERDYAYVGSFYAFSIWIGLGYLAIRNFMVRWIKFRGVNLFCFLILFCGVPVLMASQNWKNHDRSRRFTAHDVAYNYLISCAPNAILFTYGDNDTFPLWYLQEVENIRPDVRVVNVLLLDEPWYIDQMKRRINASETLPITLPHMSYRTGKLEFIFVSHVSKDTIDLNEAVRKVSSDDPKDKLVLNSGEILDYLPSGNIRIPLEKMNLQGNLVKKDFGYKTRSSIICSLSNSYISKGNLVMMDILAHNCWKRPIYYAASGADPVLKLTNYLQLDGFDYKLVPNYSDHEIGKMDSELQYKRFMKDYHWGNMQDKCVLIDEVNLENADVLRIRVQFARLADQLRLENKKSKSVSVIKKCMELMPGSIYPHSILSVRLIEAAFQAGDTLDGLQLMHEYADQCVQKLRFFSSLSDKLAGMVIFERVEAEHGLKRLSDIAGAYAQIDFQVELLSNLKRYKRHK